MSNSSTLQKPLGRKQTAGVLAGFVLLLTVAVFALLNRSTNNIPRAKPVEVPAVIMQGDEDLTPRATQRPPTSHEEAVRREYLQTLQDKARGDVSKP